MLVEFIRARLDEDELWATEASRRDHTPAPPDGVHWQWVYTDDDQVAEPTPHLHVRINERDDSESGHSDVSLRSREEFPTASVGPLPQFAVHSAGEVLTAVAGHVIRHAPARILRQTTAMRRTLHRHQPHAMGDCRVCEAAHWGTLVCNHCHGRAWPCPDVADLASIWSDHPDYQQEWAP